MRYFFCRTQAGADCDLVLARGHLIKACVEIKLSNAPSAGKGFYQSVTDLKCKNNFIICAADIDYKTRKGVRVVGITAFIKKYLPDL
jgi:predicted AAA+ superfamily ATPase